jgi:hypothetical protein
MSMTRVAVWTIAALVALFVLWTVLQVAGH